MSRHLVKFNSIPGRIALFAAAFGCLFLASAIDSRLSLAIAWAIVAYAAVSLALAITRK